MGWQHHKELYDFAGFPGLPEGNPNPRDPFTGLSWQEVKKLVFSTKMKDMSSMNKSPLKIPKGLRRFTDADWQLFCGANKFHDGSRPIIGDCYLYVDDRAMWEQASTQEGILTISLDDAGKLTVQVAVGCFTLLHEVRSLHQAFQLATWIVARKRGQARFVSELKTRGFTLC